MRKLLIVSALAVSLLSCESGTQSGLPVQQKPIVPKQAPQPIAFDSLIEHSAKYLYKYENFSGGVVVFCKAKAREGVAIAIVTAYPASERKNDEPRKNKTIAVKLPGWPYVGVGDIVEATGKVQEVENVGKVVYYLDAEYVHIKGKANIPGLPANSLANVFFRKRSQDDDDNNDAAIYYYFLNSFYH